MDLGLMASHSCPPGLGAVFNPEHPSRRVPKELHRFLQYSNPNQDLVNSKPFNLCLQQKDELKFTGRLLDCSDSALKNSIRSTLIDVQDVHPESLLLGFGIAEQCTRHEKILELLASGSIEVDNGLLELSMLCDMMGPRQLITDSAQKPFTSCGKWCLCATESLVYPARELYLNEPVLNVVGDMSSCREHTMQHMGDDVTHVVPVISNLYFSKNTVTSSRRSMLVPYFERRRRGRPNMDPSKVATEKVAPLNSHVKVMAKTSQKRKASPKTMKERDISCNSFLYACESLLSIIVDRKQQGRNAIVSLKKFGPQLNDLLTGFSASIAGTGVAIVLGVVCRVMCNQVPFCTSRFLSTGLGLGLVWLSSAVNKLRNTVISISKSSGKLGAHEEEMLDRLDRNLKDVWLRVAAVMTVAVLQLA
ncbi:hypothetical protein AAHA92_10001 [Salvia divinorum]|uniref:Uncharacterized protein n=1 Tax=Salvia divinorum TaxID=28513 RepID=A0ABD1HT80_SALDI